MESHSRIHHCLNCSAALEDHDQYCGSCGQKTHDGKLPLVTMLKEFVADQLNFDSKLLHTFRSMIMPGKLTTEYFAGKRKKQINPIRLFFLIMLIGLATFQLSNPDIGLDALKSLWGSQNSLQSLVTIDTLENILKERKITDSDSIIKELKVKLEINSDSIEIKSEDSTLFIFDYFENQIERPLRISRADFETLSPSEITKQLGLKGVISIYFKQKIKLMKNPSSLVDYIIRNFAWIYLCYIPIVAFILKLLYVRRKRYYIEHYVFSLHMHTVFIIFLITAGLLNDVTNGASWTYIFLGFAVYLFIGLKRFYSQSIFKTLFKYLVLQISYPLILTGFILLAGLVSLIFF